MTYSIDKIISRVNRVRAKLIFAYYRRNTQTLKAKVQRFTGYKTVLRIKCVANQRFSMELNINAGSAAIYLIGKDKMPILLAENSFSGYINNNNTEGIYRIRIVGENSDFELNLTKID